MSDRSNFGATTTTDEVLDGIDLSGKLVVITGAMRPERFSDSDAPINVGCAIATANLAPNGVYVAMHGIVKRHDQMQRDQDTGKYY